MNFPVLIALAVFTAPIAVSDATGVASPASNNEALAASRSADLRAMRQEEKLARDVYLALGEQWDIQAFANIGSAEQRHMNALKVVMDRFDVEDPITDNTPGVYADESFATLYTQLVERGGASRVEALKVGALIEEMDIADLRQALDKTDHPDLTRTYENLLRGSRNHLRAFASNLETLGETYAAVHLTQEDFDAIAESPRERGRPNAQRGQRDTGRRGDAAGSGRRGQGRGAAQNQRGRGMGDGNRRAGRRGSGRGSCGDRDCARRGGDDRGRGRGNRAAPRSGGGRNDDAPGRKQRQRRNGAPDA
jgi:hypothetical protein